MARADLTLNGVVDDIWRLIAETQLAMHLGQTWESHPREMSDRSLRSLQILEWLAELQVDIHDPRSLAYEPMSRFDLVMASHRPVKRLSF